MSHEDLTISANSFNKIVEKVTNAGFREGVVAGKDKSFQTGFDSGYAEGFKTGQMLGYAKGLLFALDTANCSHASKTSQPEADRLLSKPHVGLCLICQEESSALETADEGSSEDVKTLTETIERQRTETEKSLHLIQEAYSNELKRFSVELCNAGSS